MRVLIAGAADPLAQAMAREAQKQGHTIASADEGDVLRLGGLDRALLDQDAVICGTQSSEGTGNLIRAMQRHNVRRLICVTGVGAGNSVGHAGFLRDRFVLPLLRKTLYEDKTRQERLVQACDRDWMIVRPAQLTPGRARARFSVVQNTRGLKANKISRADVAVWTIAQLEIDKYLYRTVVLTE